MTQPERGFPQARKARRPPPGKYAELLRKSAGHSLSIGATDLILALTVCGVSPLPSRAVSWSNRRDATLRVGGQGANFQDNTKTLLEQRRSTLPNKRHQLVKFLELGGRYRGFFWGRRGFGLVISGRKAASRPMAGRKAQTW